MLDISLIANQRLRLDPFEWASVDGLFSPSDAAALASSFPRDHFKAIRGYDGEKGYEYAARSLIHMGAESPSHGDRLSAHWRVLAADLLSPAYRAAVSHLTGRDLAGAPMEVNVVHYGPGAWLGPHLDLKEKIVTHVLYFNETWNRQDGGCLRMLRSADLSDVAAEIVPVVGNSAIIARSESSWHAVFPVASGCSRSRRSMNVIFHVAGSVSSMWPPDDRPALEDYNGS